MPHPTLMHQDQELRDGKITLVQLTTSPIAYGLMALYGFLVIIPISIRTLQTSKFKVWLWVMS